MNTYKPLALKTPENTPKKIPTKYMIGVMTANGDVGMIYGPSPEEVDMLEIVPNVMGSMLVGESNPIFIFKSNGEELHKCWEWNRKEEHWEEVKN